MLLGPAQILFHKLTSWVGQHHDAIYRRSSSSRAAARTPPRPASKLVVPDQVPQPLRLSEATIRCGSHHHQIYNDASTRCCICSSELSESLLTNTRGQAAKLSAAQAVIEMTTNRCDTTAKSCSGGTHGTRTHDDALLIASVLQELANSSTPRNSR